MLYASMGPKSKYKFKNFLETAVYRAGDTTGSWLYAGVLAVGGGMGAIAAIGAVAALVWTGLSNYLSFLLDHAEDARWRKHTRRRRMEIELQERDKRYRHRHKQDPRLPRNW